MIKDYTLLSALDELNDTVFKEYLEMLYRAAVTTMTNANDVYTVYRAQGEVRILDRLIKDIETAEAEKLRLREMEGRLNPKNLF